MGRILMPGLVIVGWAVLAPWFLAAAAPEAEPNCAAVIEEVEEMLQQDSRLLSQRRDELAEARALCEAGRDRDALAILDAIRESSMPMGMGK